MEGKVIEDIRNFLELGGGTSVWDHQVGLDLAAAILTLVYAFVLVFPAAGFEAALALGSDF
jgi:hypothetical protein